MQKEQEANVEFLEEKLKLHTGENMLLHVVTVQTHYILL